MILTRLAWRAPFRARHYKRTFVASPDDEPGRSDRGVIEFALDAARAALDADLSDVLRRAGALGWDPECWPGEHYRLLAALVQRLQPRTVIEIGTLRGLSTLSLRRYLPDDATLTTFDLVPWTRLPGALFRPEDFADGRLRQVIGDLADPAVFRQHSALLTQADFIFVDGPKDRRFEPAFAARLDTLAFARPLWVLFDDIRELNMLRFWRELDKPKLDLTSFGHWTGTGLVRWSEGRRPGTDRQTEPPARSATRS